MKAAIYTRVSSLEQSREGISLEMQEARCREAATKAKAESVEVFCDAGFSGKRAETRPALQDFLSRLAEFDCLIVWKLDRLGRSLKAQLDILGAMAEAKVDFVSVTQSFDTTTSMGRAMLNVAGTFAQLEGELIGDRVREAHRQNSSKGRFVGRVPYGYQRKDKLLQLHPEEASAVRQFFTLYADGVSLTKLCQWATEHAATSRGGRWWTTSMHGLLSNDTYLGIVHSGGEVIQGLHEPLVDRETWQRVQDRLQENATVNPKARDTSISPILACGHCGGPVNMHRDPRDWRTYKCATRFQYPKEQRHPAVYPSRLKVDAVIWAFVDRLIGEGAIQEAQARATAARQKGAWARKQGELKERHQAVTEELEKNLRAYHANALPLDILTRLNQPLQQERQKLQENLDSLTGPLVMLPELTRGEVGQLLKEAGMEKQRRFLTRLFERVEVFSDRLRFVSRVPDLGPVTVKLPKLYAPKLGHTIRAEDLEIIEAGEADLPEGADEG